MKAKFYNSVTIIVEPISYPIQLDECCFCARKTCGFHDLHKNAHLAEHSVASFVSFFFFSMLIAYLYDRIGLTNLRI